MPSKAIASLDAWLEAAERLLQEQREFSVPAVESDPSMEQRHYDQLRLFRSGVYD
jgi:hypothetical protein